MALRNFVFRISAIHILMSGSPNPSHPEKKKCSCGTSLFAVGSFTSHRVFQEGNPREWRDRLAVDETWTVTVHVDLGAEGR